MSGCADPGRPMDVYSDIALVGHDRLARVDSDPHPDRPVGPDDPLRGSNSIVGATEGDEECIPLRVNLDAVRARDDRSYRPPMVPEEVRITHPVFAQQPRRTFDVREEESDDAR